MSCGPILDKHRVAVYCGMEKHDGGKPLQAVFEVGVDEDVSGNWIEHFNQDAELALVDIRKTCGLDLGVKGAYPVLPVRSILDAINSGGATSDVTHTPDGQNTSHASVAWQPRQLPVDRRVALQLSQQPWCPYPAVL